MPANWKTQKWPQDWKRSVFITIPKKGNAKECSNYRTVALISHTSKIMLKIFQARLQQYMNCELPDVQAEFRKGRGYRDQIANIFWILSKYLSKMARKTRASPKSHRQPDSSARERRVQSRANKGPQAA